jgi:membrane protease YdiL (CAAX protease family)
MEQVTELRRESSGASLMQDVWKYLALTFGFAWVAWIVAIKLDAGEEFLNFGTAGPVFAAMILSRRKLKESSDRTAARVAFFVALLMVSWIILSWQYRWRGASHLSYGLNPWLILPAILPAWILSSVVSRDSGVRGLLRRLVRVPDRWSAVGFLIIPAILIFSVWVARLLHQRLVSPVRHGSMSTVVAAATMFFLYNVFFVAVLEEPGWRGFLLDRLQQRWSPLVASLLVWLPWALWHAPLDYFRPERFSLTMYLEIRVVFLIPIVILLTWLYNRSGRSIQATAMFHASMNTFPFVLAYFLPGFALIFLVAIYVVVADRMWRREPAVPLTDTAG